MVDINPTILIIILNVSNINTPIKKQRLLEWIRKTGPPLSFMYKKPILNIKTHSIKKWRKLYHNNTNQKKAGLVVLISDRANFRAKKVFRNKERHYIKIKGSVLQKGITILNVYAPNNSIKIHEAKTDRMARRNR